MTDPAQTNTRAERPAVKSVRLHYLDWVAMFLPNCPQLVIAYYGTLRAGGIAVPSNFLYTAEEMEHQLNDAGAQIVVTLSSFYSKLDGIRANTRLRHIVVTNIKEYFPPLLRLLFTVAREKKEGHRVELASGDDLWLQSLLSQASPAPGPVEVRPEDTACLIYTGGTTARAGPQSGTDPRGERKAARFEVHNRTCEKVLDALSRV